MSPESIQSKHLNIFVWLTMWLNKEKLSDCYNSPFFPRFTNRGDQILKMLQLTDNFRRKIMFGHWFNFSLHYFGKNFAFINYICVFLNDFTQILPACSELRCCWQRPLPGPSCFLPSSSMHFRNSALA